MASSRDQSCGIKGTFFKPLYLLNNTSDWVETLQVSTKGSVINEKWWWWCHLVTSHITLKQHALNHFTLTLMYVQMKVLYVKTYTMCWWSQHVTRHVTYKLLKLKIGLIILWTALTLVNFFYNHHKLNTESTIHLNTRK